MKRLCKQVSLLLIVLALLMSSSGVAFAMSADAMRSSPTLNAYSAILKEGTAAGKVIVSFDVAANKQASSLGVSSIKIYKANGSYVTTINGTVQNGLKATQNFRYISLYTYTGISGTSYYAEVTVFATIDGVTDSRTITTTPQNPPCTKNGPRPHVAAGRLFYSS